MRGKLCSTATSSVLNRAQLVSAFRTQSAMMKMSLSLLVLLAAVACAKPASDVSLDLARVSLGAYEMIDIGAPEGRQACVGACRYPGIPIVGCIRKVCLPGEVFGANQGGYYCCLSV